MYGGLKITGTNEQLRCMLLQESMVPFKRRCSLTLKIFQSENPILFVYATTPFFETKATPNDRVAVVQLIIISSYAIPTTLAISSHNLSLSLTFKQQIKQTNNCARKQQTLTQRQSAEASMKLLGTFFYCSNRPLLMKK